ncbi:MAG: nucleoside triphosphate hydrolase [Pseudomonadota bacterium]
MNDGDVGSAAVFPMDGYHFDDHVLCARGWRRQKGAPHTFDVHGFAQMLSRLHRNEEDEIAIPVFDREIEISRNSARLIARPVRHLIVEGNYLLLDRPPWTEMANLFDTTVSLEVPMEILRDRLSKRWKGLPAEEQRAKLEDNDLPNARLVQSGSRRAEFVMMP